MVMNEEGFAVVLVVSWVQWVGPSGASLCVVSLVCCVVVLFFVVVSFFLFSAGSLSLWFGWERCAYIMLVKDKSLVNLDLMLLVLFLLCFVSIY